MAASARFGSSLSPLILRLTLAFIFITAGLPKLKTIEFTGPDAQRLVDLGVVPKPATPDAPVTARSLHQITLMLDAAHHPQPVAFAWVAALTEVGAGTAVLLGILTRLSALGLSVTMGYAFYFTTYQALLAKAAESATPPGSSPSWLQALMHISKLEFPDQAIFSVQLTCFAMSLALLFSGPGRFALDALFFGPRRAGGGSGGGGAGGGGGGGGGAGGSSR